MRIIKINIKLIAKELCCQPELLYSPVCIVDNECANDLALEKWDYTKSDLTIVGLLWGEDIIILARQKEDSIERFKKEILNQFRQLSKEEPIPLFAFNNRMETGNFKGFLGIDMLIDEVKPFNCKSWNKNKFFQVLKDKKIIPEINLKDPFNDDSNLCTSNWKKYIEQGDESFLMQIIMHNINCLIKESIIYKNQKYFEDNYIIDNGGWMIREKTEEEKQNDKS